MTSPVSFHRFSAMSVSRRSFLRSVTASPLLLGCGPRAASSLWAQQRETRLPRGLPEEQGVDSRGVLALLEGVAAAKLSLHSLMLVRHGRVIAQGWWAPYAPHLRHTMYSLSKSFCATAVGIAAAEKRLSLDDKVVSFFPNDLPEMVGARLADLRVRHLLMMGTGHPGDSLFGPGFTVAAKNWVKSVLSRPLEHAPGTHFAYNNGATFLCSAIVQQATGQTLLDFLNPRLFAPLGIAGADWEQNPQGMNHGAFGLRVRTEDIAKLGQLYLSGGSWEQAPVLTTDWVREAPGKQIENAPANDPARRETSDWAQGYGYQFWRCRHGAFRGDGAFGQYCVVLPDQQTVLAMTSETNDLQGVLNAVWKHLLPALAPQPLPANPQASGQLRERLSALSLPVPQGKPASPRGPHIDRRVYAVADNALGITRASFVLRDGRGRLSLESAAGDQGVEFGLGRWLAGDSTFSPVPLHLVSTLADRRHTTSAAAAWTNDDTLVIDWRFTETAHGQRLTCAWEGEQVRIAFERSVTQLNPATKDPRPVLVGS